MTKDEEILPLSFLARATVTLEDFDNSAHAVANVNVRSQLFDLQSQVSIR
ncbi:hypothetical protein SAMN05443244_1064 [Terriglobus roseus]|jgi:hypothetical protein|uniref:Uncharacterized protein n=1 Tax=Terriglobus roseus TaxID=392734 RepID=A0A1H4K8N5_9BACT|nr:hypothetical protein SAMN05443244_1064 [Terriglobus roseus]